MNQDHLLEDLQRANQELRLAYEATIEGWVRLLELRDRDREGHTRRVTELTLRLALEIGIPEEELVHIRRGALLHDIGTLAMPDAILFKPGVLPEEEWNWMRQHPGWGYELLSPILFLQPALDIVYCHHERWDGSGYPRGLKGQEIPLSARIFAVVDVWDALLTHKPHRRSWRADAVMSYLKDHAGKEFDPQIVTAFLKLVDDQRP